MININIVKLGSPIQKVEVEENSKVMVALTIAGFDVDAVMSIKRNGTLISIDDTLLNGDMLIVTQEKIKGGNIAQSQPETVEGDVVAVGFDVTHEGEGNRIGVDANLDLFTTVKNYLKCKGLSMNNFVKLTDKNGAEVAMSGKPQNEQDYTIVLKKSGGCQL